MKNMMMLLVVLAAGSLLPRTDLAQTNQAQSQQAKKHGAETVTMQGCVSRESSDFILMQSNPGNSYVLDGPRKIKLDQFLGQQVEVTGIERPTMSSSNNFTRRRAGSSVTIWLDSIKTISKECAS
jgi:hypothetical protein